METIDLTCETINNSDVNNIEPNNNPPQSSVDNESDEDQEVSNHDWTYLPEPAVDHIYSFLSRSDQCRMSLICKRWSKNYDSPCLWRSIKFYLPEHHYSEEIYPEVRFARKYGQFFRNVEIICKRYRSHLFNEIYAQLKHFLEALSSNNSHLHSVKFISLLKYFRHLDENEYLELLETTKTFFETQTNLRYLEFRETYYRRDEGADILDKACKNNFGRLKSLVIKGFVTDPVLEEDASQPDNLILYSSLQQHLMSVNYIRLDYSQFLEKLLQALYIIVDNPLQVSLNRNLSLLEIACEASRRLRFQGIPPNSWKKLKNLCPKLKVHITLTASAHPRSDYRFFIVENLPLRNLEFRIVTPHEARNLNIDEFFQHLRDTKCLEHLENLTIVWMPYVGDLSSSLAPFLQIARKLKTIQIFLRFPVEGIENLFQSWVSNRPPSLESAHISISRVRQAEDCSNITRIADEYSPILQVLGLNVILVADTL